MCTHCVLISLVDMETAQLNIQPKHLSAKENKLFLAVKSFRLISHYMLEYGRCYSEWCYLHNHLSSPIIDYPRFFSVCIIYNFKDTSKHHYLLTAILNTAILSCYCPFLAHLSLLRCLNLDNPRPCPP